MRRNFKQKREYCEQMRWYIAQNRQKMGQLTRSAAIGGNRRVSRY
jgi:hypothetical protein